ncbi:hypothetical protein [Elstera cyanobacteriorum]|uniref:Uncharacterized protein n=1 Tax=Elstera cyanobacteriorum TaxID=2022747 RepID=A0A255XMD2_9PROT|nr:hypothetical protein [Elstera cyanobacteriorum]MCK6441190.1 hypothetical protein [Elstera cyanobacteriorum]OYQ18129.1 hypothetical protein CHR90_14315 [Elstera cyanobacteriorum]GFZ83577.1 hypothetical protein GCM10011497_10470 [Elstera cyanobacteriorum]
MNKFGYILIGVLIAVIAGLGAYIYREQTKPKGLELRIDSNGVSIQNN